jgi:hypothetical protein
MKPGDVLGDRFEIGHLSGSGGMGAVYRAEDLRSGGPCAVKVLWSHFAAQPEHATRFTREAELLQELDHPGIVRYLSHGVSAEGEPYLALEWLDGESLAQRLRRQGLPLGETLILGRRVAEALGATHRRGVVHRDLKPSNLFLVGGAAERVKLLDFGIAKVDDGTPLTVSGVVMGTPFYMAPEQARGMRRLDARADVFALGCVLFHCLTGRTPFAGDDVHAALLKVVLDDAPRVSEVRDGIPPALDALVARMLCRAVEGRPADGDEVAKALAAIEVDAEGGEAPLSRRGRALTGRELRVVCAVVVKLGGTAAEIRATQVGLTPATAPMTLLPTMPMAAAPRVSTADLLGVADRFQGRVHASDPSVFLVSFAGSGAATDEAAQAARCALAMRAILPEAPMAVVAGRAGTSSSAEGGEVLERGSALAARSGAGIPIDELIAGLVGARFHVAGGPLGLLLAGERDAGAGARTVLGKPTPCVGRDHEIALLDAVLAECVAEPCARAVLVIGGAGIGKSRLAHELSRRAAATGAAVWTAQGDPMSAGSPFGMLGQMLRREVGLGEGEPLDVARQKFRARAGRHLSGDQHKRVALFLGEIGGVPFDGAESVELRAARGDAVLMGDQMRRAWEDFLVAESQAAPLLLVLEDLHWGDLPSVKFLDATLRNLPERPILVAAMGRPEVVDLFPKLWADRGVQQIHLREISRRGSERLVREVLGDAVGPGVAARIVELSAGNPFYLEELIRAAAEGRADDFPETVLAMAGARLDAVSTEARRVLRAASVFGQVFWRGGVAALIGGDRSLGPVFGELLEREIVARRGEGRFPGEEELGFRHGLLREAAYATLPATDRALGHRLAGAWLEQKGEREALVLAEHQERGGEPERAVAHYRRAAEQALEGDDFAAAIACAERGAAHADGEELGALRLVEAEAHKWRGKAAEAERCAAEAMRRVLPRSPLWYVAAAETASMRLRLGRHHELAALASEVQAMGLRPSAGPPPSSSGEISAEPPPPASAAVSAVARLAGSLLHDGQHALAEALIVEIDGVSGLVAEGDFAVAARVYALHASRALCYGDPAAALRFTELSIPSFAYTGDRRNACLGSVNAAAALLQLGAEAQAERALRSALADAERMGLGNVSALARQSLAAALSRRGALEEARALATAAVAAFADQENRRQEGRSRAYLAEVLAARADGEGAEREARAAVACVASIPPLSAFALAVLSRVLLTRGDVAGALAAATAGTALRDALSGMEEGEALLGLALAEALDASGERPAAEEALRRAHRRILARAGRIADPGWRSSFLRRVPENARTVELARSWIPVA